MQICARTNCFFFSTFQFCCCYFFINNFIIKRYTFVETSIAFFFYTMIQRENIRQAFLKSSFNIINRNQCSGFCHDSICVHIDLKFFLHKLFALHRLEYHTTSKNHGNECDKNICVKIVSCRLFLLEQYSIFQNNGKPVGTVFGMVSEKIVYTCWIYCRLFSFKI